MKRVLLAVTLLLVLAVAAWGANPIISMEAIYTDNNSAVDISNIAPYREVEFKYAITADTPSIRYSAFVMGNVGENNAHNIHEEGTISTTASPIPYNLKVTFISEEEGYVRLYVFDANGAANSNENNFKAIKGTPPIVNVTGVKIADGYFGTPAASMTLEMNTKWNNSKTLEATIEPENATNKSVIWASDNEAVATVSNGNIEAKGPGKATITVTTEDGGFTATCVVTVTRDGATSLTLDQTTMFMAVGDTRYLWVTPDTYFEDYQIISATLSAPDIVSIKKGESERALEVTALKAGETTLTVSTEGANGNTIKATCAITVMTENAPNTPSTQDTPDTPTIPDTTSTPDIVDTPDIPDTPVTPESIDTPTTPDTQNTPVTPDTSTTDMPRIPDSGDNNSSGGGGGCNAGLLGGIALAALALKKR